VTDVANIRTAEEQIEKDLLVKGTTYDIMNIRGVEIIFRSRFLGTSSQELISILHSLTVYFYI
jgi:hypothetical protein